METTTRLVDYLKKNERELELKVQLRTDELHQTMVKLNSANNDLINANHEKNEFLGIVVHDLKNPLSSVQMMINYILVYLSPDKEIEYRLKKILPQVERMFNLLKNLLDINILETGQIKFKMEKVIPIEIISTLYEEYLDHFSAKKITINLLSHENNKNNYILVDRHYFLEILDNLFSNALKFSPIGSDVKILIDNDNEKVSIRFIDNGPGISMADQNKLFQIYSKLSARPTNNEHSSGLGLYIVKNLTEKMGGLIRLETSHGHGSTFILEFPIVNFRL